MIFPKTDTRDLTSGPIIRQLATLTYPLIFSSMGMMLFNVIDIYFVSKLGIRHVAALSFTFPIIMAVMSIALGLEIGTTALVSQAIGKKDKLAVKNLTTQSLLLSFIIAIIFTFIGLNSIDGVFGMLGADENLMPLIKDYMSIWYLGIVVLFLPMVGSSAIRSTGDTKFPSKIILIAVITNIALDPILIFGLFGFPAMGMQGAALATVLSRLVMLFLSYNQLHKKLDMIFLNLFHLQDLVKNWKALFYLSLPVGLTNLVIPLSFGFIVSLIAYHGTEAIAAYGIATRLEGFLLTVVIALNMALPPFVGQNWGARKYRRINLALKYSAYFIISWGILIWIFLQYCSVEIISMFSNNFNIINVASYYYLMVAWIFGFRGVLRMSTTILTIIFKPFESSLLTIFQFIVLLIPMGYIGDYFFGLKGIFIAFTLSYLLSGSIAYYWIMRKIIIREELKEFN